MNESDSAYMRHGEELTVWYSNNREDTASAKHWKNKLDSLWEEKPNANFKVITPNRDFLQKAQELNTIKNSFEAKREWAKLVDQWEDDNLIPKPKDLREHQKDGLNKWVSSNFRGILEHATGSGKTKLGTWLCKTAWVRKFQQSSNINMIPPTIHMPPNVEKSWDFETQMANYLPRLLPESYLSGTKRIANQEEVEWGRKQSPIIMYDEAHHFYSSANRGKNARDHYAESVILLTATPISKGVNDAESCIKLLGTENVDSEVIEGIRDLKRDLKKGTKEERRAKIAKAGSYLQSFTIRRTRNEINDFSDKFPEKYTLNGRRLRYPDSQAIFYHMRENASDERELKSIQKNLEQIRGLGGIASVIERTEKEVEDKENIEDEETGDDIQVEESVKEDTYLKAVTEGLKHRFNK